MAGLLRDSRFAVRQLRRNLGFTITAAVMLAVAICANSTVFSWIDGTMLHPLPGARDTGQLVSVMRGQWNTSPTPPLSYLDYRDLRDQNQSFTGLLAYHSEWSALTSAGAAPERIYIGNVSATYFDVLGVKPLLGRFFLPGNTGTDGTDSNCSGGKSLPQRLKPRSGAALSARVKLVPFPSLPFPTFEDPVHSSAQPKPRPDTNPSSLPFLPMFPWA